MEDFMKKTHSHDSSRPKPGRGGPTLEETKLHTERLSVDNDSDEMTMKSPCQEIGEKYSGGGRA
jgi:hypothetical protein